jgi:hypothetical protein
MNQPEAGQNARTPDTQGQRFSSRTAENPTTFGPVLSRSPMVLSDLTGQLLWPKLLTVYRLALAPWRIVLCFAMIVTIGLINQVVSRIANGPGETPIGWLVDNITVKAGAILRGIMPGANLVPGQRFSAGEAVFELFIGWPLRTVKDVWWLPTLFVPLVLTVFVVFGIAVCRSAALKISMNHSQNASGLLAFSIRKTPAGLGAMLLPMMGIWVIGAICAGVGQLLFSWGFTSVIGALLMGVIMLMSLLAGLIGLGFGFGQTLLLPAIAMEGTDSFDAIHRTYSYILAKPGKLAAYQLIAVVCGVMLAAVLSLVGFAMFAIAWRTTDAPFENVMPLPNMQDGVPKLTESILRIWLAVALALGFSVIASFYFCACTMVYTLMRRSVDGQDIGEVYQPS